MLCPWMLRRYLF